MNILEDIFKDKLESAYKKAGSLKNYTAEDINQFDDFIKNFILQEGKDCFGYEEVRNMIDKSVRLLLNYTLRPTWTLLNYLFGGFDSRPVTEVKRKAEIFPFYLYYYDAINYITSDETSISVTRIQAENALSETNKLLFEKLQQDLSGLKIKNFFLQVFKLKYGQDAEISLDMTVPFLFIKLFLTDKEYFILLEKFNAISSINDSTEIELKEIIKILTDKFVKSGVSENISGKDKQAEAEKEIINSEQEDTENKIEKQADYKKTIFTDEEYKRMTEDKEERENEKESKQESSQKIKLKRYFNDEELLKISKKIFKSNKFAMYDTLDEIERMKTWRETTVYLKKLFKENKVNLYDKYVVRFVDVLSDYFEKRNP